MESDVLRRGENDMLLSFPRERGKEKRRGDAGFSALPVPLEKKGLHVLGIRGEEKPEFQKAFPLMGQS